MVDRRHCPVLPLGGSTSVSGVMRINDDFTHAQTVTPPAFKKTSSEKRFHVKILWGKS